MVLMGYASYGSAAASQEIGSQQSLTLNQAINLALANNPDVKRAAAAIRASAAARKEALGAMLPHIQAMASYKYYSQPALELPGHMDVPTLAEISAPTPQQSMEKMLQFNNQQFQDRILEVGIGVSWPVFTSGRLSNELHSATMQEKASHYDFERIRQNLVFIVTQIYLDIQVLQKTRAAELAAIDYLSSSRTHIAEFVKVGTAPRLALLRVDTRLESLRQALAGVNSALQITQANLAQLLGMNPEGTALNLADELDYTGAGTAGLTPVATSIQLALEHRPDYQALLAKVKAQNYSLSAAEDENWPVISLEVQSFAAHGNNTGGPVSTWEHDTIAGLSLSVPIFAGGVIHAHIDQQQARLEELNEQLIAQGLGIRKEVIQAYAYIHEATAQVAASHAAVASANEAFRIERQKVTVGRLTVTDLLDSQAEAISAQVDYLRAIANYRIASVRLALVTGAITIPNTSPSTNTSLSPP